MITKMLLITISLSLWHVCSTIFCKPLYRENNFISYNTVVVHSKISECNCNRFTIKITDTTKLGKPDNSNSSIGILKPRVIVNLSKSIGLGFEHQVYYVNRHLKNNPTPTLHLTRTEQKVFLQIFLEDPRRRGRYH